MARRTGVAVGLKSIAAHILLKLTITAHLIPGRAPIKTVNRGFPAFLLRSVGDRHLPAPRRTTVEPVGDADAATSAQGRVPASTCTAN